MLEEDFAHAMYGRLDALFRRSHRDTHVPLAHLTKVCAGSEEDAGFIKQPVSELPRSVARWNRCPDIQSGSRLFCPHTDFVASIYQQIAAALVNGVALLEPGLGKLQGFNRGILDGTEHAAIDIAFQAAHRAYQFLIADQHANAEPRHIVRFAHRVQFNRNLAGSWNLQDADRTEIVEIDLGIGHVMNNHQLVFPGELDSMLKESFIC